MNRFSWCVKPVSAVLACARILLTFFLTLLLGSCVSLNSIVGEYALVYPDSSVSKTENVESISWSQFKKMGRSGTLSGTYIFQPGEYPMESKVYVRSVGILHLVGSDRVRFSGVGKRKDKGFVLASSHIFISDFYFDGTSYCFKPDRNKSVTDVLLVNIGANNVNDCMLIDRDTAQEISNWVMQNIEVKNYYRSAVRIAGSNTHDIALYDFILDGGNVESYCWKGGVQIYNAVSNIDIYRGVVRNNIGGCQGLYQQGDGIEVDDSRGVPSEIFISDVTFENNADADLDLKGKSVQLQKLSMAGIGHAALKLWHYEYSCISCCAGGESNNLLILKGAIFSGSGLERNSGCVSSNKVEHVGEGL